VKTAWYCTNPTEFLCFDAEELLFEEVFVLNINTTLKLVEIVSETRHEDVGWIWVFKTREAGVDEIMKLKERLYGA